MNHTNRCLALVYTPSAHLTRPFHSCTSVCRCVTESVRVYLKPYWERLQPPPPPRCIKRMPRPPRWILVAEDALRVAQESCKLIYNSCYTFDSLNFNRQHNGWTQGKTLLLPLLSSFAEATGGGDDLYVAAITVNCAWAIVTCWRLRLEGGVA